MFSSKSFVSPNPRKSHVLPIQRYKVAQSMRIFSIISVFCVHVFQQQQQQNDARFYKVSTEKSDAFKNSFSQLYGKPAKIHEHDRGRT